MDRSILKLCKFVINTFCVKNRRNSYLALRFLGLILTWQVCSCWTCSWFQELIITSIWEVYYLYARDQLKLYPPLVFLFHNRQLFYCLVCFFLWWLCQNSLSNIGEFCQSIVWISVMRHSKSWKDRMRVSNQTNYMFPILPYWQ